MRGMRLDLALQLHGSGGVSNGIVLQWQARHTMVFHEPQVAPPPGTCGVPWPDRGSEPQRLMRLLQPLGPLNDVTSPLGLSHPVSDEDRRQLNSVLAACGRPVGRGKGWVCMHPGSKWLSRRWPVARFAEVARELSARGHDILVTGAEAERPLIEEICRQVPQAINLCGRTDLWTLGAAIDGARMLICNDTGVSHIAAALGVPSVVVSCGSEVARWSPADPLRHRVLWSAPPCRPCMGSECSQPVHRCAQDITVEQVLAASEEALLARRS
jgi:ADP-heptose:LPS heptosyltransferase